MMRLGQKVLFTACLESWAFGAIRARHNVMGSLEFATSELVPNPLKVIPMFAVEHILNEYNNLRFAAQHANTTTTVIRQYMLKSHHHLFNYLGYSHACAAFATMAGALATFSWNFMDLFIAITSIALAERFRLLNRHLQNVRGKVTFYMLSSLY
jgi:hypothetical protein